MYVYIYIYIYIYLSIYIYIYIERERVYVISCLSIIDCNTQERLVRLDRLRAAKAEEERLVREETEARAEHMAQESPME